MHHAPTVLVEMDDDATDTGLGPGIIAVEMITCQPFTVDIELENQGCSRARRGTFDNRKRVRRGTFDTRVLQSTTLGVAEHNASVEEREHMTGRRGFAQYC